MYVYDRAIFGACAAVSHPAHNLSGLGQTAPPASQTYSAQPLINTLSDANFWNIFTDRNRVVVVSFWSDTCRPCDEVARIMSTIAENYSRTTFSTIVNFNQIQWDP